MGTGAFSNALKPYITGLFNQAKVKVGEGLFKASNTEMGIPLSRSVGANAVNNLPGFYEGPIKRAKSVIKGGLTTANDMVMEQLNPFTRKLREQTGISRRTQKVAKKNIDFLEGPVGQDLVNRKAQRTALKKGLTAAEKRGDEEAIRSFEEKLSNVKKLTTEEQTMLREAGSEIQGQFSYQFLQNEMQGTPSNILTQKFLDENYVSVAPLTKENFNDLQYVKYWETERVPDMNGIMETAFNRIDNAWGADLGVDNAIMFAKKTKSSDASGNLVNEINRNAKVEGLVRKALKKRGKGFDNAEQMQEYLTKELKDPPSFEIKNGALWFGESFTTSVKELGGVNLQNAVLPDGTAIQFMSDVQDLFSFRMPAGKDGLSVSLPLMKNFFKSKKEMPKFKEEEAYNKLMKLRSKERAGLFDEFNVMESMRTGDAPAMPAGMGGMNPNQTALAKEIAQLKPDSLTLDEWVTYVSKMGIGASIFTPMAEGMLSGSEK